MKSWNCHHQVLEKTVWNLTPQEYDKICAKHEGMAGMNDNTAIKSAKVQILKNKLNILSTSVVPQKVHKYTKKISSELAG
jgi:hypothetical protein